MTMTMPKLPLTADRAGQVLDAEGTVIGLARFLQLGQLTTTQLIARHFAASFETANTLRRIADQIVKMQDAGHDSQKRSEALYELVMLEGVARENLAQLEDPKLAPKDKRE